MRQMIEFEIKTEAVPDCITVWPDEMAGLPRRQLGVTPFRGSAPDIRGEPLRGNGEVSVRIRDRKHQWNL